MAIILIKSAFQPIFGNPEPDVPAHAGIVRSRRGCKGQGSHSPHSKLKLSAKSQYLFYRTATDSKNFVSLISYQVQVIGIPVRQKADFTHGQSFCGIPCVGRPPFVTETLAEGTAGSQRRLARYGRGLRGAVRVSPRRARCSARHPLSFAKEPLLCQNGFGNA